MTKFPKVKNSRIKITQDQECIPVGYVLSAPVAVCFRGVSTPPPPGADPLRSRSPPDQAPPSEQTPGTRHPPAARHAWIPSAMHAGIAPPPPWTE